MAPTNESKHPQRQRGPLWFAIALVVGVTACESPEPPVEPRARHQLMIVLDGLRPDLMNAEGTPNLYALSTQGVVFGRHHAVVPTLSGVNAVSLMTGAYPQAHGLLGHEMYLPEIDSDRVVDVGRMETLRAMQQTADGRTHTARTLGRVLDAAGKRLAVVTFWHVGTLPLMNEIEGVGASINPFRSWPQEVDERTRELLGRVTADTTRAELCDWVVDATLRVAFDELRADTTVLWMSEPDHTAHAEGVGSPETLQAAREVDAAIGRLLAGLEQRGLRDQTNIFVASDHGLTSIVGGMKLPEIVAPFDEGAGSGEPGLFVTLQAVYERTRDPERLSRMVAGLQAHPNVGAIFTRPAAPGSPLGVVPGTLSFELIHWNHPRAASLLTSGRWTDAPGPWGRPGTVFAEEVVRASHASTAPYDIHATLFAVGPDIKQGVRSDVPTAIVDLAPTLLRLQGVAVPATMDGRVLHEAFRGGPAPGTVEVERETFEATAPASVGAYRVEAHTSRVAGHVYFDYAKVRR